MGKDPFQQRAYKYIVFKYLNIWIQSIVHNGSARAWIGIIDWEGITQEFPTSLIADQASRFKFHLKVGVPGVVGRKHSGVIMLKVPKEQGVFMAHQA